MEATAQQTAIEPAACPSVAPVTSQKSTGMRVAQNTLAALAGRGLGLLFSALASVVLTRHLGVERLGEYGAVYAFASMFIWLASAGLAPILSREAAQRRDQAGSIFFTGIGICAAASALTLVLALLLAPVGHLGGRFLPLLAIASVEVLLLTPLRLPGLIFQVDLRQWYDSAFSVARQGLWLGLVLILYWQGAPLVYVILGRLVVALAETCLLWHFGTKFLALPRRFSIRVARTLVQGGAVIALTALASSVYLRIDQVMLHSMAGDRVLGGYVAAVRISELFEALPFALGATMFPLLCAAADDPARFDRYLGMTYRILIVTAAAICVAITTGASSLVTFLYGSAFQDSANLLSFLIWSEIAVFFNAVVFIALVAVRLERYLILATAVGAAMNVGLNILLIPGRGAMGSAWATLAAYTTASMVVLLFFTRTRPIIWKGLQVALPATGLGLLVSLTIALLPTNGWLRMVLAMILFGACAMLFRLIQRSDIDYARDVAAQVWTAVGRRVEKST
jgi:O-antigen/teichoic acid export membrane protein